MSERTAPKGLTDRARKAWRMALTVVDEPDRYEAAVTNYARAITRADRIFSEWVKLGRPVLDGAAAHPLMEQMEAADRLVNKHAEGLGLTPGSAKALRSTRGRPKTAIPSLPSLPTVNGSA